MVCRAGQFCPLAYVALSDDNKNKWSDTMSGRT